jgi:hypothetical protein
MAMVSSLYLNYVLEELMTMIVDYDLEMFVRIQSKIYE